VDEREYHEQLWSSVPVGAVPAGLPARRDFALTLARPGVRALDVGCGEGQIAAALTAAGAEVVAVDVARVALERAGALHPGLDLRLVSPGGDWELEDSSFDLVWAGEVIEHVLDTAGWLSEVRRVLRSGGTLGLSTPDHGPLRLARMAVGSGHFAERMNPLSDHLRFYNRRSLTRLLAAFGFEAISARGDGGVPGARTTLLARATRSRF
jgi:2-polyprenyl-3-methyl-5-hydroxy-6-metoxy-1,4-benzoquinol methylase